MVAVVDHPPSPDAQAGRQWLAARLPPLEMRRLDRQGFVSRDQLPSGTTCSKLRFRDGAGRQRVLYLGVDRRLADQIAAHLAERQARVRRRRALHQLRRRGHRLLREVQPRLAPHVDPAEWHFHGRQLRRKRRQKAAAIPGRILSLNAKGHSMIQVENDQATGQSSASTAVSDSQHDKMRQWAQDQRSPFDAAVGCMTADLCELATCFAAPIKKALQAASGETAPPADVVDDVRLYLQITRQAERCLRLAPRGEPQPPRAKNRPVDTDAAIALTPAATAARE